MKVLTAVLLFAAAFCFCAVTADEAVLTLTEENFDSVVNAADIILVEFYAPWCGHCKRLAPEYETAAQTLKDNDPPIQLAKVDATEQESLGRRFEVRGYPTLFVFRKGQKFEYDGPREADGIVQYMKKQAGPASRRLDTAESVKSFTDDDQAEKVVFVAFFDNADAPELAAYRAVAERFRSNFKFGEVVDKSVGAMGHSNRIVAFKKFDDKETVFEGQVTESALAAFVRVNSVPQFGEFTLENAANYRDSGLPVVFLYFDVDFDKNVKRTNYYTRRLEKVSADYKGKIAFVYADKEQVLHDAARFGASGTEESVLVIEDFGNDAIYKFADSFNVDNVKKFVDSFLAGNLKPHVKSEPVPESNDGPVKVVVGQNFNEIVMDDSKDVLIEFYAPWCGHCKSLAPVYEELGNKVKDVNSLVIAKIDATANDWPKNKFQVSGYPTIYFKPANSATPKRYDGGRDVDSFVDYLKQNAAVKFSLTSQKDEL